MHVQNPEAPVLEPAPTPQRADKLHIGVASTIEQVVEAWQLVYQLYRRIDIIDENPVGMHTNFHTIHPNTTVIVGNHDDHVISTMSIMHDSIYGMPLDRVYSRQLNLLRRMGRPIVEVGLLADRRDMGARALVAIMEMMRHTFWHAYHHRADIVCGVHPHHADFYIKALGFDVIGPVLLYPTVRNRPVVLLRLDIEEQLKHSTLPRCINQYYKVQRHLTAAETDGSGVLGLDAIMGTPIADYLQHTKHLNEQGVITTPVPSFVWREDRQTFAA